VICLLNLDTSLFARSCTSITTAYLAGWHLAMGGNPTEGRLNAGSTGDYRACSISVEVSRSVRIAGGTQSDVPDEPPVATQLFVAATHSPIVAAFTP
jgi:hypothetical protein